MKKYAIIVAGGTGTRMQGDIPKQFILLCEKPVIQYSLETFYAFDPSVEIILVIHADYINYWKTLCEELKIAIPFQVVAGGKTRFDSVKNALQLIDTEGYIAIHDAARPLITAGFVQYLFSEAELHDSTVPGVALNDTIRLITETDTHQLDRTYLRAMQTPQVFKARELKQAYNQPYNTLFTDDASVMQAAGFPLHFCDGLTSNIKITSINDLRFAEAFLNLIS